MTNRISVLYIENEIELSWPIEPGVVYDKNEIGQWHDRIGMIYIENDTRLSTPIWPGTVVMKTRKDNKIIDCTSVVYAKIEIELLRPMNQVWYVAKTR